MRSAPICRFRPGSALATGILTAAVTLAGAPAEAQVIHLFPCKIVCGYQAGNVRLLNDTSAVTEAYEDLKPGNYATTCNMFSYDLDAAQQTVLPYVAVDGEGLLYLGSLEVAALTTDALGCVDLVELGLVASGPVFQGYLAFFTLDPDFTFDAVYTYSSQNAFERHVLWFYTPFGPYGLVTESLGLVLGSVTNPLPAPAEEEVSADLATASGAGGLGLGASIDVEGVERLDIDVSDPANHARLPPEIREILGLSSSEPAPAE